MQVLKMALAGTQVRNPVEASKIQRSKEPDMDNLLLDVTPDLQKMFDLRLAQGRHVDAAEYVRDLIRRDMLTCAERVVDKTRETEGSQCK
jgi:hypothetical protein